MSELSRSESLVLFSTTAALDQRRAEWVVPVHGWVYLPQSSRVRRTAIATLLRSSSGLELTAQSAPIFDRRINLLLADNKRGRRIVVEIAGRRHAMSPTAPNGHFRGEIRVQAGDADHHARSGVLRLSAVLASGDHRQIGSDVRLVPPRGLTVISDIDDTVKVTHVTNRQRMWEATFFRPFEAVPGMAALYQRLAAAGASFHYVSSSPWHLYSPLTEFLAASGFPPATLALKAIRLKDRSILDIVKGGAETKPPVIAAHLARFPERTFILIGDSGEDDPEVYGEAARRHPDRIAHILIRNVPERPLDAERSANAFRGIERSRWQSFNEVGEVEISALISAR